MLPWLSHSKASLGLDFLFGLKQPLVSLGMARLLNLEDVRKFEKLVEKHAQTLESLEFIVSTEGDAKNGLEIQLPALPNLQDLDFSVHRGYDKVNRSYAMVILTFPGDTGIVNYKAHLPSIRTIRIVPYNEVSGQKSWEKYGNFFDTFLPKKVTSSNQQEVCTTLKRLYIPYKIGEDPEIPYPRVAELAGMFPNVGKKFMTKFTNLAAIRAGMIEKEN
ncbi:hypothetical protein Fcan01_25244 [Folsomia candida]|uniref:Uncharacterized protein n=1 Tax=Folsomia candida TaxID=158441 RepID=A0A226D3W4_FOLCA|nr:hypothetical protein Fcan01_25244 [Folsomia candida]